MKSTSLIFLLFTIFIYSCKKSDSSPAPTDPYAKMVATYHGDATCNVDYPGGSHTDTFSNCTVIINFSDTNSTLHYTLLKNTGDTLLSSMTPVATKNETTDMLDVYATASCLYIHVAYYK